MKSFPASKTWTQAEGSLKKIVRLSTCSERQQCDIFLQEKSFDLNFDLLYLLHMFVKFVFASLVELTKCEISQDCIH